MDTYPDPTDAVAGGGSPDPAPMMPDTATYRPYVNRAPWARDPAPPATPHAIPHRYHRAWTRTCSTCGHRETSPLLLTIHIACPNGCGTMGQPPQHTAPDVETVTEWLTCGVDAVCPDHR